METHNHMKEKGQEKFHSFYNALHCWILLSDFCLIILDLTYIFIFGVYQGPGPFFFFFLAGGDGKGIIFIWFLVSV